MLTYKNDEMLNDNVRSNTVKRYIIIDVNSQGILELDVVHQRLKENFPKIHARIKWCAFKGKLQVGGVYADTDNGYDFRIICTRNARIGKQKDDVETVTHNTLKILRSLESTATTASIYESGFLNRDTRDWDKVDSFLRNSKMVWFLYKK